MCELLKSLMGRFLKSQVLKETEGKHLLTVEYSKSDNLLSNSQTEVGENTGSALSELTTDQQKVALTGTKRSFLCGDYKVPDQLLRDVFFLHPNVRHSKHKLFVGYKKWH